MGGGGLGVVDGLDEVVDVDVVVKVVDVVVKVVDVVEEANVVDIAVVDFGFFVLFFFSLFFFFFVVVLLLCYHFFFSLSFSIWRKS